MSNLRKDIAKDSIQERIHLLSLLRRNRREEMMLKKRGITIEQEDVEQYTINDFLEKNLEIKTWEYYLFIKNHLHEFDQLQLNQNNQNQQEIYQNQYNEYSIMKILFEYGIYRLQKVTFQTNIEEIRDIINGKTWKHLL